MPANFTSGWLGNGERAWHGQGVVTDGTLPAREAFETAEALFTVEKRELMVPKRSHRPRWHFLPRTSTTNLPERSYPHRHRTTARCCLKAIRDCPERFAPSDGRVHPRRGRHGYRHRFIEWCQSMLYRLTPWCGDGHRPWRYC